MSRVQTLALAVERPARRAESDATLLIQRVGSEIASLAHAVGTLQQSLGPAIVAMAGTEPALIMEAQKLDLIEQTLSGLSTFMTAVGRCRIGRDPLDLEGFSATLTLAALAARLAGGVELGDEDELDLF